MTCAEIEGRPGSGPPSPESATALRFTAPRSRIAEPAPSTGSTASKGPAGPAGCAEPLQERRRARSELVDELLSGLDEARPDEAAQIRREVAALTLPVARSIAGRYRNRGVDRADLDQIACLGLMKALHRWKPGLSDDFLQFAVPTITGEVKRFFRDRWWTVRPPRRLQEARAELVQAEHDLRQRTGTDPTDQELAGEMSTDVATVREARQVRQAAGYVSLDDATPGSHVEKFLMVEDDDLDRVVSRVDVAQMLDELPERDRAVLELRFYRGLSQADIGREIGVSQMQVSRILRSVLDRLRQQWEDQ